MEKDDPAGIHSTVEPSAQFVVHAWPLYQASCRGPHSFLRPPGVLHAVLSKPTHGLMGEPPLSHQGTCNHCVPRVSISLSKTGAAQYLALQANQCVCATALVTNTDQDKSTGRSVWLRYRCSLQSTISTSSPGGLAMANDSLHLHLHLHVDWYFNKGWNSQMMPESVPSIESGLTLVVKWPSFH